jgi:hypothetical protein
MPQAEGNGRAGNVIHPRGVAQGAALAPAATTTRAAAPTTAEPRPAPIVRRAAAPAPSPARTPAPPKREGYRIPFLGKLIAIAIAGAVAVEMLGTQRQELVAIVSWMLITAGSVQMLAVLVGPRDD